MGITAFEGSAVEVSGRVQKQSGSVVTSGHTTVRSTGEVVQDRLAALRSFFKKFFV
jgi:hypothetical protein